MMVGLFVIVILVVLLGTMASKRPSRAGGTSGEAASSSWRELWTGASPADQRVLTEAQLQRAAEAGIVTADQVTALLAFVGAPAPPVEAGERPRRAIPAAAEIFGYLGAILASIGAATLVGQFWDDMASWARLTLIGALSVGLWVAGALVDEARDAVLWRLRGFLWFLSSGTAAFFAGLFGGTVAEWDAAPVAILIGAVTAVHAGLLWRRRDRPAQYVACAAGVITALAGVGASIDGPGLVGLILWVAGGIWLLLGWRRILLPAAIALVAAPALMLVAAGVTSGSWDWFGPLFGLATAAGLLAGGTVLKEFLLTGVGVVGVFVFLPMSGAKYFGDTIGVPIVLLGTGVLLIVLMVLLLRRGAGPRPLAH